MKEVKLYGLEHLKRVCRKTSQNNSDRNEFTERSIKVLKSMDLGILLEDAGERLILCPIRLTTPHILWHMMVLFMPQQFLSVVLMLSQYCVLIF
jgi:hypothetical protein